MNKRLNLAGAYYYVMILLFVISGCKNNPPVIIFDLPADSTGLSHGEDMTLFVRFVDDNEELESSVVFFNDKEVYNGCDSLFEYSLHTSGLNAGGYLLQATAKDRDGNVTEKSLKITVNGVSPVVSELSVNEYGATWVNAVFRITDNGGLKILEKGLIFQDANSGHTEGSKIVIGNTSDITDEKVEGFPRDSELLLRAYARNNAGISYSEYVKLKTMDGIPVVRTGEVAGIHSKTADACGNMVTDGGEGIISYGICYSEGSEPSLDDFVIKASGQRAFRVELNRLKPFTVYYYRAYARNRFATRYGDIMKFETTGPPTVLLGEPGRIKVNAVYLNIDVTDDGGHPVTDAGICYSMLKNPGIDNNVYSMGKGSGRFEAEVVNLDPGARYYFRAYAVNSEGVSYSDELILFTKIGIPVVNTVSVRDIDCTSATVAGNVPDDGGLEILERGVVWDTVANPTKKYYYNITKGSTGPFECTIKGLETGKKYYVRAYAKNERGYVYADPLEFIPLIKTEMVMIEGVTFSMGNDKSGKVTQPVHQVKIDSFLIGKYEVANQEFVKFLNSNIDDISFEGDSDVVVLKGHNIYYLNVYGEDYEKTDFRVHIYFKDGSFHVNKECGGFPAILVSWEGAMMYCKWAGGRLPTEAEWESAARGGRNGSFVYSGSNDLDETGWYYGNSRNAECKLTPDGRGINRVGLKKPNSIGIFDMSGNVSEWCYDIYYDNYYSVSPADNPMGPKKGSSRVIRGGSWADRENNCTVFTRIKSFDLEKGYDNIGFRLVRTMD